ncbi:MAG: D-hexose-6-phosphate mutarotase [Propionivibrio sp.]
MNDFEQAPSLTAILDRLPSTHRVLLTGSTELFPELHPVGATGLPMLRVDNPLGRAVIALQGAHVMAFQPKGQRELLWVSPKCVLAVGQPIRGGIPLCLPWFGPGPDGQTMHGFGRTSTWSLLGADAQENGATRLTFELTGDASTSELWPHAFVFRLEVSVGRELQMTIVAQNIGQQPAPFAFAFHTYFAVGDVAAARVSGLDGCAFIDKTDQSARKTQSGDVTISTLTDRIYLDVPVRQTVSSGGRQLKVESDTRCAVVWNAWTKDRDMPDLGEGNHVGYLCVERGDVADHAVTLAAGREYRAQMTISC